MTLYYDRYKCDKCEREYNLAAGAVFCPHCGGALRRIKNGKARTAKAMHFLSSAAFGAALPVMALNRVTADAVGWYVIGTVMLVLGMAGSGEFITRKKRKENKK